MLLFLNLLAALKGRLPSLGWLGLVLWGAMVLPVAAAVEMRVAVELEEDAIAVGSSTPAHLKDASGQILGKMPAGRSALVNLEGGSLQLENLRHGTFLLEPTDGGHVFIDDRWYRGAVLLLPQQGKLLAVNLVDLEAYLYGVIGAEMPSSWPQEALRAQAVAARSYALYQRERARGPYDVSNTTASQVYGGLAAENSSIHQAVDNTRNQILTYGGRVIEAVFHASSGGHTENVEDIWQRPVPYLRAVQDFDQGAPVYQWNQALSQADFQQRLPGLGNLVAAVPERVTPRGRVASMRLQGEQGTRVLSGNEIRKALGLRSTLFTIHLLGDQIQIIGRGYGHGIGLSQWGAHNMALQGHTYQQILSHYYQGATLSQLQIP